MMKIQIKYVCMKMEIFMNFLALVKNLFFIIFFLRLELQININSLIVLIKNI